MGIASDMKNLGEDIVVSYDARISGIAASAEETANLLAGFRKEHKKMATDLRKSLDNGEADRLKEFKELLKGIQTRQKERENEVSNLLAEFQKKQKEMADVLRDTLEKGETERLKDFAKLLKDIQARQREREKEVSDLLNEFKAEREKMAANWQALTAKMAKRRGIKPKVEAKVKVRPVEKAVEEVEVDLEKEVLKFIKKHPEGVKVSDMEEPLGVARTRLGVIAKRLFEEGKVRKEENLYFPL